VAKIVGENKRMDEVTVRRTASRHKLSGGLHFLGPKRVVRAKKPASARSLGQMPARSLKAISTDAWRGRNSVEVGP
jgi:hypothetical protein